MIRMKQILRAFLFLGLLSQTIAFGKGDARPLGLGVILGEPTGLTGKYFFERNEKAIDFGLAYSFGEYILVYGDYLYHFTNWIHSSEPVLRDLDPYLGVGAGFLLRSGEEYKKGEKRDSIRMLVRVPLGAEWRPKDPPLGVFLELVPGVRFVPNVDAEIEGGIGIRYYF